jgi:predicted permease
LEKYENSQFSLTYISVLIVFGEKIVWTFVVNYITSGKEKYENNREDTPLLNSDLDQSSDKEDLLLQRIEKEKLENSNSRATTCLKYFKQIVLNPPFIFLVLGKNKKLKK